MDMNRLNNDVIREKLNSLDTLPEGYSPNLTSKWEVLEAGLGEKTERKKPVLFWVKRISTVAAIALFIGGSGVLLIQRPNKPVKQKAQLKEVISPVDEQPVLVVNKNTKPVISRRTKTAGKQPESVVKPLPVKANEEGPVSETFTQMQEPMQETEAVATATNERVKRPARFTEVDFNEPVITAQPPSPSLVKAQRFRFKLGLGNNEQVRVGVGQSTPIGFKTGF